MTAFSYTTLAADPLIPFWGVGLIFFVAALIALGALVLKTRYGFRAVAFAFLGLTLLNPVRLTETRIPQNDTALIVVDRSGSQDYKNRPEQSDQALNALKQKLQTIEGLDVQIVETGANNPSSSRILSAIQTALETIPAARRAGTFIVTDGQIHDTGSAAPILESSGPIHALITGDQNESDRALLVEQAPAYGIVDKNVEISVRVQDKTARPGQSIPITVYINDSDGQTVSRVISAQINRKITFSVPVSVSGQNVISLDIPVSKDEITAQNNRKSLVINGIRDRLRVLLVSGMPHAGERTWRNLLTGDPSVDLVHFTILRSPDRIDLTPNNEMALIAFPFHELFEEKLYDFDLIILDRYRQHGIMPPRYFENIARYAREGGALLVAPGPAFLTERSLDLTAIGDVLPARPEYTAPIDQAYRPALSKTGQWHPVTQPLAERMEGKQTPDWGQWHQILPLKEVRQGADILLTGPENRPLLMLERFEQGRIAQLASDQIWLWQRQYDGGGPYASLIRRTLHWLMKEPSLDENRLDLSINGDTLSIRKRKTAKESGIENLDTKIINPDESDTDIILRTDPDNPGWLTGDYTLDDIGVYQVKTDQQSRFIAYGDLNPPELGAVTATSQNLAPLTKTSGGGVFWIKSGIPDIKAFRSGQSGYRGAQWAGIRRNGDYLSTDFKRDPLLPAWIWIMLGLGFAVLSWWFEARHKLPQ